MFCNVFVSRIMVFLNVYENYCISILYSCDRQGEIQMLIAVVNLNNMLVKFTGWTCKIASSGLWKLLIYPVKITCWLVQGLRAQTVKKYLLD